MEVQTSFQLVPNHPSTTIVTAIQTVATTVFTAIQDFFTTIWTGIYNFFSTIFNAIYNVVSTVFQAIYNVITTVWNAIYTTLEPLITAFITLEIVPEMLFQIETTFQIADKTDEMKPDTAFQTVVTTS